MRRLFQPGPLALSKSILYSPTLLHLITKNRASIVVEMETALTESERAIPEPLRPEPPVRILVQTLTHLVPGNGNLERTRFILDRMCQHHWNCDFEAPKFRWAAYNDQFALNNRRCFFLVDYGESKDNDDVPLLCYQWTGQSL